MANYLLRIAELDVNRQVHALFVATGERKSGDARKSMSCSFCSFSFLFFVCCLFCLSFALAGEPFFLVKRVGDCSGGREQGPERVSVPPRLALAAGFAES